MTAQTLIKMERNIRMKKPVVLLLTIALALSFAAPAAAAEESGYRVFVTDVDGEPVSGVIVQFCSETECIIGKTDENGLAVFDKEAGEYNVHILKTPDTFSADSTEYAAPEVPGLLTIVLQPYGLFVGNTVFYESSDLEGNPLRSLAVFSEAKVTMINIWATWCPPCRAELPELGKLAKEFEEQDCRIIGVCIDADNKETAALAMSLLNQAGADYLNLWAEEYVFDVFPVYAVPTSVFVDREGKILLDPVIGADLRGYRTALSEALSIVG